MVQVTAGSAARAARAGRSAAMGIGAGRGVGLARCKDTSLARSGVAIWLGVIPAGRLAKDDVSRGIYTCELTSYRLIHKRSSPWQGDCDVSLKQPDFPYIDQTSCAHGFTPKVTEETK